MVCGGYDDDGGNSCVKWYGKWVKLPYRFSHPRFESSQWTTKQGQFIIMGGTGYAGSRTDKSCEIVNWNGWQPVHALKASFTFDLKQPTR